MDSYQATYDAVRSRISNGNVGDAVMEAMRNANISHYFEMAMYRAQEAISNYDLPSAIYRPKLFPDGNHWIALYGEDLQSGVVGTGKSPAEAIFDFDRAWHEKLPDRPTAKPEGTEK